MPRGADCPYREAHSNLREPTRPVLQSTAGGSTGACVRVIVHKHTHRHMAAES